jgi:hypothetical protein
MFRLTVLCHLVTVIAIANLKIAPTSAQVEPAPSNQTVEDLIETLNGRDRRMPPPMGSRGEFCAVSPGILENPYIIWGDRPLFLWEGEMSRVIVRDAQGQELWSQPVAPTDRSIVYGGEALQPGQLYEWTLVEATTGSTEANREPEFYAFRIMQAEQRIAITERLQSLSEQLQASRATPEEIAVRQAQYLIEQGLWSDALKVLYTVESPSSTLIQARQEMVDSFCTL